MTSSRFGVSVATGDVNGDGYADIAAGAYGYSTNTGRVYVFQSTGSLGVTTTLAASATTRIAGEATNHYFGWSVAVGDANGDGYADLVAGANRYSSGTGRVYVFHSTGGQGVTATLAAAARTLITGEATSYFGASVATGDVNGDGYADLVAGASRYNNFAGRVYVFHSAGSPGVTATLAASASPVITGEATSYFGVSVATVDANGDGNADVVAGAYTYSNSAGRVYVFHSTGSQGVTATNAAAASTAITGQASSDFGYSLAP